MSFETDYRSEWDLVQPALDYKQQIWDHYMWEEGILYFICYLMKLLCVEAIFGIVCGSNGYGMPW